MGRAKANTIPTTFRLTPEARRLLVALAERKGINRTATLEVVIRDFAKREGVK
ncbi:MAG: hypothetical protein ACJ789_11260 [Thermomicrobiales bacterium]